MERVTKEGRHLTYEMDVIQQPERARACGSGAKSSADRRPVDPPPVVQLRIFEGDAKQDITFSHNANFFLFTTLEPARQIAQGRVPPGPAATSFPVLTGMPVAGMAYLDRPTPGGYFIFPDLSVRHEGKFRLSFNLFEELKEEKDEDVEGLPSPRSTDTKSSSPASKMAPKNFAIWRLEVKSKPFSVFSAKKFPGLSESTNLSRVVAEQGCRVRIRRDVRMRRRDPKSKDYDEFEDNAYGRADRFGTPLQQVPERPRSISNGSVHGSVHASAHGSVHGGDPGTPYAIEHRRSSQDLGYYNQPSYVPPPIPVQPAQPGPSYSSHLTFGSNSSQYATPSFQPPPAPIAQPPQRYVQPNNDYQYQPNPHTRQISTPQNFAYPSNQPQQPSYQQTPMYTTNTPEYKPVPDYRRASLPASHQGYQSQSLTSYPQSDSRQNPVQPNYYQSPAQNPAPRSATPNNSGQVLPPIQTLQPPLESKYESFTPSASLPASAITPSSSYENMRSKFQPYATTSAAASNTDYTRLNKRSHEQVFDNSHQYQSLHSGMRPSTFRHGQDVPQVEAEDGSLVEEYDMGSMRMLNYKRADGTKQTKKCPSPIMT